MTQRETDLPEGTDKVVTGAMDTDPDRLQNSGAISAAGEPRKRSSGGSRSGSRKSGTGGGSGGGSTGNAIMEKVRSGSDKLSGQAADKARGFVGQGIERSAEALSNVSKLVGETASGLDERLGKEYGDYARRAAETLESTAGKISAKDPDELIDDTRTFIRKSPGVALAGAAIVGFALARLVKTGLSAGTDDDEDDRGPRSPRKRS